MVAPTEARKQNNNRRALKSGALVTDERSRGTEIPAQERLRLMKGHMR
jgi:hypothetical protein